jgi:hypothetical protein
MTDKLASVVEPLAALDGWRMAGDGRFIAHDGAVESDGGPGLFWYRAAEFGNFVMEVDWRIQDLSDNSGVFVRVPMLGANDRARDWRPAVEHGYEIQIDDRGYDPQTRSIGSALHMTGAIYRLAPALRQASNPPGVWNRFRIVAQGLGIAVALNGIATARLTHDVGRRRSGHVALQCHHTGSRVQFRRLRIEALG